MQAGAGWLEIPPPMSSPRLIAPTTTSTVRAAALFGEGIAVTSSDTDHDAAAVSMDESARGACDMSSILNDDFLADWEPFEDGSDVGARSGSAHDENKELDSRFGVETSAPSTPAPGSPAGVTLNGVVRAAHVSCVGALDNDEERIRCGSSSARNDAEKTCTETYRWPVAGRPASEKTCKRRLRGSAILCGEGKKRQRQRDRTSLSHVELADDSKTKLNIVRNDEHIVSINEERTAAIGKRQTVDGEDDINIGIYIGEDRVGSHEPAALIVSTTLRWLRRFWFLKELNLNKAARPPRVPQIVPPVSSLGSAHNIGDGPMLPGVGAPRRRYWPNINVWVKHAARDEKHYVPISIPLSMRPLYTIMSCHCALCRSLFEFCFEAIRVHRCSHNCSRCDNTRLARC